MNKVFLGLGGNLHDRVDNLLKAREFIQKKCGSIVCASSLYETEAWGTSSQNKFLNQVILLYTSLRPEELLQAVLQIERDMGRLRTMEQYSDRLIDIDILFFNDIHLQTEDLTIPHPMIALRKFVLVPLCEIAPDWVHPSLNTSLQKLLDLCEDELEVHKH